MDFLLPFTPNTFTSSPTFLLPPTPPHLTNTPSVSRCTVTESLGCEISTPWDTFHAIQIHTRTSTHTHALCCFCPIFLELLPFSISPFSSFSLGLCGNWVNNVRWSWIYLAEGKNEGKIKLEWNEKSMQSFIKQQQKSVCVCVWACLCGFMCVCLCEHSVCLSCICLWPHLHL